MNVYVFFTCLGVLATVTVYFAVRYYMERERAADLEASNLNLAASLKAAQAEREAIGETIQQQQEHISKLLANLRPFVK